MISSSRVLLGTMNFAWNQASSYVDVTVASEMLRKFAAAGGTKLDTARIYAAVSYTHLTLPTKRIV